MTLRDVLLPAVNKIRTIPNTIGIRLFTVTVRVRSWTGDRVGLGAITTTDTALANLNGSPPKVRQLSGDDVVASGGTLSDQMFEIGPLTPSYIEGLSTLGTTGNAINPPTTDGPQEILYVITGPGLVDGGIICKRISDDTDRPFRYTVTVKQIGVDA
jgi:hypothetical protein